MAESETEKTEVFAHLAKNQAKETISAKVQGADTEHALSAKEQYDAAFEQACPVAMLPVPVISGVGLRLGERKAAFEFVAMHNTVTIIQLNTESVACVTNCLPCTTCISVVSS